MTPPYTAVVPEMVIGVGFVNTERKFAYFSGVLILHKDSNQIGSYVYKSRSNSTNENVNSRKKPVNLRKSSQIIIK